MIDIIRFLECFLIQNESSIQTIININITNSYSFNQELNFIKYEFDKFLLYLNFHKDYIKLSNEKSENKMEIESKKKIEHISNILVDNREMGATTPFYLYQKGFNINVGQLEVGDYILSNSLCIERKSISTGDIFQSLKSHHLTDQIIKMLKYYGYIIILLEFENFEDILKIINNGNLFTQINLYKKFLELKNLKKDIENNRMIFIWSLSSKMTAQIIINLKIKYNDQFLDIEKCINMNKIEKNIEKKTYIDNFLNPNDDNNDINNENNIEKKKKRLMISIEHFLRRIDGIDNLNIHLIFNTFKNLNDLIQYPNEQLYETIGRLSGNKIQKYLNQNFH
jgi:DNA excision repair protein ERCC-4